MKRWDHITGYSVVLAENIEAYSINASGERISLLRSRNVVANGEQLFDLEILDFASMQISPVIEQSSRMHAVTISPDGQWIAYFQENDGGIIYVVRDDEPGSPIILGECHPSSPDHCTQLLWSHDSDSLLWVASEGIWASSIELRNPHLVHSGLVETFDPEGTVNEIQVIFDSLSWSPNGRYLLTHIVPSSEGVHWWAVIDTDRGRLVNVPVSTEIASRKVGMIWTQNGDLLAIPNSEGDKIFSPLINLWQIVDTKPEILLLKQTLRLLSQDFPISSGIDESKNDFYIDWPTQYDQTTFTFGITTIESDEPPILFSIEITKGDLRKLVTLPIESREVKWSPDGLGVLVMGEENHLYFISVVDGTAIDLKSLLGMDAHSFTWLPPAPRV